MIYNNSYGLVVTLHIRYYTIFEIPYQNATYYDLSYYGLAIAALDFSAEELGCSLAMLDQERRRETLQKKDAAESASLRSERPKLPGCCGPLLAHDWGLIKLNCGGTLGRLA